MRTGRPFISHPGIVMLVMVLSMAIIASIVHTPGYNAITGEVKAKSPQCFDRIDNDGDGFCDFGTKGYKCRDGSKKGDRDCSSRYDNTEAPEVKCGDNVCSPGESCSMCALDCGVCPPVCGNGKCESNETCNNCQADCGVCPTFCGDGACNGNETCSSCSLDCGSCLPRCGDGLCNGNETCSSCSADCPCQNATCTDSDGGRVYGVRGKITGSKLSWDPSNTVTKSFDDGCVDFGIGQYGQVVSSCTPSANCKIDEYFCQGGTVYYEYVLCPYGCKDGACVMQGAYCGDGSCNWGETCYSCAKDCVCPPVCGDGQCNGNETCSTCSKDCGNCSTSFCRDADAANSNPYFVNSYCEDAAGTHWDYCDGSTVRDWYCTGTWDGAQWKDQYCAAGGLYCQNGCLNGACVSSVCGNGKCEGNESCVSCPQDCGVCPPKCGDGQCTGNETCSSCSTDCGACKSTCFDSDGENYYTKGTVTYNGALYTDACLSDGVSVNEQICRLWSDGSYVLGNKVFSCSYGCQSGACLSSPPVYCGNGKCDTNETCSSCSKDCGNCTTSSFCQDNDYTIDRTAPSPMYVKSSCVDVQGTHYDYCESSSMVRDWYCTGTWDGTKWTNQYCAAGGYGCPYGCQDGACVNACGNGKCDTGETCSNCAVDCAYQCTYYCGDGKCDPGEVCSSCSKDCGVCPSNSTNNSITGGVARSKCGNGRCEVRESCSSCPKDCGVCPPFCGNGRCEVGEGCGSCPRDCGSCNSSISGMMVRSSRYYYAYS